MYKLYIDCILCALASQKCARANEISHTERDKRVLQIEFKLSWDILSLNSFYGLNSRYFSNSHDIFHVVSSCCLWLKVLGGPNPNTPLCLRTTTAQDLVQLLLSALATASEARRVAVARSWTLLVLLVREKSDLGSPKVARVAKKKHVSLNSKISLMWLWQRWMVCEN